MRDEGFALAVARLWGLDGLDAGGSCCLPGHTGAGRVIRAKDNQYVYTCDCTSDDGYRSLTDTYMSAVSGRIARPLPKTPEIKNPKREKLQTETTLVLWTRKLLSELGAIVPDYRALPSLPADANESTRAVYEGLRLFLGLRVGTVLGEEFTFTRQFVADWCGISLEAARAGLEAIRAAHIIEETGKKVIIERSGLPATLYRIGGGA
jgi:hypothetical protein